MHNWFIYLFIPGCLITLSITNVKQHDNWEIINLKWGESGRGLLYGTIHSFTSSNLEEQQNFGHILRPL